MPHFWFKQHQQRIHCIAPLMGLTGCSQKIVLENGECYVWRQQQRATHLGIGYQREAYLLTLIAPLNFAPKPIYCSATGTLLSWIEGKTPPCFSTHLLEKLANHLATLHQFDLQATKDIYLSVPFNLAERCQFLWQQLSSCQQQNLTFTPPFTAISPFQLAICHHDIHLQNLIINDEQLFIIDWEYSAISDPALDIALFFSANALTKAEQGIFLANYFAKTGFDQTAFTEKMAQYYPEIEKLSSLWFLVLENSQ